MRHYSDEMLEAVNKNTELIQDGPLWVIVKPSVTEPRPGYVDRILWERLKGTTWGEEGQAERSRMTDPADVVRNMRENAGVFNENINSVEIHTKYEEISVKGNTVGLWRYYPRRSQGRTDRPALIFFHGGGWVGGSVYSVENACRYLAEKADAVIFNVDYSLAPEKPYPNGVNDNYGALCHVYEHAAGYGIDPQKIAICGDSAGGNYAAVTAMLARDKGYPHVALQVMLYPATMMGDKLPEGYRWDTDLLNIAPEQRRQLDPLVQLGRPVPAEEDFIFRMYGAGASAQDPYISPALAESHAGLPPALVLSGEFDGLRLQAEFYAGQLSRAGVPVRCVRYRGLTHAFLNDLGFLPQAEDACNEIAAAILEM